MSSIDDDSDAPHDSVKGIALRICAFAACGAIAFAGFWMAFPNRTTPPLLPIPPVPPRIASTPDYEKCVDQIDVDPYKAVSFAGAWIATGGGDAATQCLGLAQIATGDMEPAAETLEKLSESDQLTDSQAAAVSDQAAQAWLMARSAERAYTAETLALSNNPDNIDWIEHRARIDVVLGRMQDALDDLDRALILDPTRLDIRVLRGATWRRLGQFAQAHADIDLVLSEDPDRADALVERGVLHHLAKQDDDARRDWQRAASIEPGSPVALLAEQDLAGLK